jgi:uroporphyrinogen-III synthase
MRRVLVLRPEPGASATVERARACGLKAIAKPLFEVEPIAWDVPEAASFDALLLTSANALRHGGEGLHALRGLPVYAVGDATAEAAREAGFDIKGTGDAGVERLLGSLELDLKLLHLAGEDRTISQGVRQEVTAIAVYRAREKPPPDFGALEEIVALIHSPRSGRRFAALVEQRSGIAIAAISPAAADAVGGGWESVDAADVPNDDALLALAARLCNKPKP